MEITFETVFRVIRKAFVSIIVCALVGAVGAFLVCKYLVTPTFVVSTEINLIGTSADASNTVVDQNNKWLYANRLVTTCASILEADTFKMKVAEVAGVKYKPSFSVYHEENNTVLEVKVKDSTPKNAYNIALAIAELSKDHIVEKTEAAVSVSVVDDPLMPTKQSSPDIMMATFVVGFIAAALVFIIYLLREILGTRIRDEVELAKRYDIPVLASIPDFNEANKKKSRYYYYNRYYKYKAYTKEEK